MLSINPSLNVPSLNQHMLQKPVPTFGNTEDESDDNLLLENEFGDLIAELKALLGKTKGLALKDIDVKKVQDIMAKYESKEAHWGKFALSDATKGYTRNGIVNINGNANLLILVWLPGKGSAIHDHANAHCCMKILKGELTELLYDVPEHEGHPMVPRQVSTLKRNEVGYILDDIGLHKISNETSDFAVSLHLYTPPYASLYGCSMYELGTARKHHVDMSRYYSWQGQLVNAKGALEC